MSLLAKALNAESYDFHFPMEHFSLSREVINNLKFTRFLKRINQGSADFKFVHHHHGYYGISEIYNILSLEKKRAESLGNEFFLFTCIREPMSFQISRINYLRNSCGMPNLSFDDAVTKPKHQNVMYKYLLYNHPKRWKKRNSGKDYFLKNLGIMDRVFLLEEFEHLIDYLERITGTRIPVSLQKANKGKHFLLPDKSQLEGLARVNHLDQFFYSYAKQHDKKRVG